MLSFCDLALKKEQQVIRGVFLHNDEEHIYLFTRTPDKWISLCVSDGYMLKIPVIDVEDIFMISPVYLYERFSVLKLLTPAQKELVRTEMMSFLRYKNMDELIPFLNWITVEEAALVMMELENGRFVKRGDTVTRESQGESNLIDFQDEASRAWFISSYMGVTEKFQAELSSGEVDLTEYRMVYYEMTIGEIMAWQSTTGTD